MDEPELPKSTEETTPPVTEPGVIPPEERQMAMFTHLAGICLVLGPLIMWQVNKEKYPSLEAVAKEAMNFNIGVLAVCVLFSVICILSPLIPVVWIAGVVFSVIAGTKANDGIFYRYPATLRLIK